MAVDDYDFSAKCESGQTLYYKITSNREPYTVSVTYPKHFSIYTGGNSYSDVYYYNYTTPSGDLTIPDTVINGGIRYAVKSINYCAFYYCSGLTSITIPNSVTSIDDRAFKYCYGMTEVTIPDSVTEIGIGAFSNCESLTAVNIPNSVTNIENDAFYGCSSLISVSLSQSITSIVDNTFNGCSSLKSIDIPETVNSIGGGAFLNCSNLETIYIPNSITYIGYDAFAGCNNLQYNEYDNAYYLGNDENPFLYLIKSKSKNILTCEINNNCKYIYSYAFSNNKLTTITIPNSVISIGNGAFSGCSNLTFINIPNSVTTIFSEAFANCEGLTMVAIPNSVNKIEYNAFNNSNITFYCEPINKPNDWYYHYVSNYNISDWHYNTGTIVWGVKASITDEFVFYATDTTLRQCGVYKYVGNDTDVEIPSKAYFDGNEYAVTNIGFEAFDNYTNLLSVSIPESVRSIGVSAFGGCTGLTSITLPDSLVSIGHSAFGCTGLTSIRIPNTVTTFGDYAFVECADLASIVFPDSIKEISSNMFRTCRKLTYLRIPNTVTKIGEGAFNNCSGLKYVTIPKSVTTLERVAFDSEKIIFYCEQEPNPVGWASNWNCGKGTVYWNVGLNGDYIFRVTNASSHQAEILKYIGADSVLSIPASVTFDGTAHTVATISESAFKGCENLKAVTIPDVVENIGDSAFYGCNHLPQIVIPNSVAAMGQGAFGGCSSLTIYSNATSKPKQWSTDWNPDDCPVVWGTKIDGDFIYQITNAARREISIVKYAGKDSVLVIPSKPIINSLECSITRIGDYAFAECDSLVRITIPNSVQNIGDYAFAGCSRLSEVVIGSGIASIGESAFSECGAVSTIKIGNAMPPTISESTFEDVDKWITIDVPCTNIDEYKDSDYWSDFVNYYEPPVYAVTVKAENSKCGNVTIIRQPTCDNNQAIFEATSNTGFAFAHWNDGNTENPRSINVVKDTTVIAQFVPDVVTLTLSSNNTVQGTVSNASGTYHYGDNVEISATANYGYHFSQWSDGVTQNPRTIQLIKDTVVEAQFAVNQYSIQLQSNDTNMGSANGAGSFDYLSTNKISATPKTGYVFYHWSDENTDNPRTITLTRDTAFTAVFVPDEVNVEVKSADTKHGTVTESTGVYHFNEKIIISAIAVPHYHFVAWSDGNRQNPRELLIRGDTVLTAAFGIDTFSVAAKCDTAMGAVSGAGLYSYGSAVKVEAKPAAHHHFVRWTSGAVQTTQEFVVEHDTTFEAVFAIDRHSVALAASDSLCGAVSGAGSYDYGASVQLQATPAANCYFTGWSDGVTTNPRTLTVEGDTNIVAEFGKLQTVNIMVAANDTLRGTVAGTGSYVVGNNATLSATASAHYLFEQWSDGRTDNPRTVRVIADATYTAVFVPMQYNIILSQNNADMGMVSGSGVYSYGERVSCLAKPYPNYHFVQWSNGETANPYEFVVEEDKMLTAYFAAGAVTAIGNESAIEPTIYAIGKTIVVENATDEIRVYDAMGKLICRDAIHRVRAELRVNAAGVYIIKTGNVVMRVVVE